MVGNRHVRQVGRELLQLRAQKIQPQAAGHAETELKIALHHVAREFQIPAVSKQFARPQVQEIPVVRGIIASAALVLPAGIAREQRAVAVQILEGEVEVLFRVFVQLWHMAFLGHDHHGIDVDGIVAAHAALGKFAVFVAVDSLGQVALYLFQKLRPAEDVVAHQHRAALHPAVVRRVEAAVQAAGGQLFQRAKEQRLRFLFLGGSLHVAHKAVVAAAERLNFKGRGRVVVGGEEVDGSVGMQRAQKHFARAADSPEHLRIAIITAFGAGVRHEAAMNQAASSVRLGQIGHVIQRAAIKIVRIHAYAGKHGRDAPVAGLYNGEIVFLHIIYALPPCPV